MDEAAREYTAAELREIDRLATEEFGIPSLLLMERAAIGLAEVAGALAQGTGARGVVVFAGPGNNGGDGLCAARHLHNAGFAVRAVLAAERDRVRGDAAVHLRIAERLGLEIFGADRAEEASAGAGVAVDALFGTGLARPLRGAAEACVLRMNALRARGVRVVAADLPCGLQSDTGEVLGGVCVTADETVTFAGLKPAIRLRADLCGRVTVAGIGVPPELLRRFGGVAARREVRGDPGV